MVSRYNHSKFDPDILMPQNRSNIISMLGRKEHLDHFLDTMKRMEKKSPPKLKIAMTKEQKVEYARNFRLSQLKNVPPFLDKELR